MGSDISRQTFDKAKHYSAVVMQQGRVQLDADWNEQQDITAHRIETVTVDAVGPSGAPNYAPGFAITADSSGKNFTISKGRYYLDGFLCENEDDVSYANQPDFLDPPALADLLSTANTPTAIIYLDVWQRPISALEDPHVREQALGGPDTAGRVKTVWQVKFLPVQVPQADPNQVAAALRRLVIGLDDYHTTVAARSAIAAGQVQTWANSLRQISAISSAELRGQVGHTLYHQLPELRRDLNRISRQVQVAATVLLRELGRLDTELGKAVQGVNCHSAFDEWFRLTAPSTARLTPQIEPAPPSSSPCPAPAQSGLDISENQLYRVEVQRGGDLTNPAGVNGPTFKWSRDDASMAVGVTRISGTAVTVTSLGLDDLTKLAHGQWVEVLDDRLELAGQPGQLAQIDSIDPARLIVTMKQAVGQLAAGADAVDLSRHPKLRRWDQDGDEQGLPIDLTPVALERGINVVFSPGTYQTSDYWLIPARSDGMIEWPPFAAASAPRATLPPLGITHHYSRLGLVEVDVSGNVTVHDCRRIFAPLAAPAMRVVATNWENDNDFSLTQFLNEGLVIAFDAEPFPPSLSPSSMILTIEIPAARSRQLAKSRSQPYPARAIILAGEITVVGNTLRWLPDAEHLREVFALVLAGHALISDLRLRVVLKGPVIHSDQQLPILHLDGQAFGQAKPPQSGAREPTTALIFPTGAGAPASDFESWFYLLDDTYGYGYGYGYGSASIGGHLI